MTTFDAPELRPFAGMRYRLVRAGREQLQVLASIVQTVSVEVMNMLVRPQTSAKFLFDNPPMFVGPPPGLCDLDAPVRLSVRVRGVNAAATDWLRSVGSCLFQHLHPKGQKLSGDYRLAAFRIPIVSLEPARTPILGGWLSAAALAEMWCPFLHKISIPHS